MNVNVINNEIVIKLPIDDYEDYSEILNYLKFLEITSKSQASNEDIDKLIGEVKKGRWKRFKAKREVNA